MDRLQREQRPLLPPGCLLLPHSVRVSGPLLSRSQAMLGGERVCKWLYVFNTEVLRHVSFRTLDVLKLSVLEIY